MFDFRTSTKINGTDGTAQSNGDGWDTQENSQQNTQNDTSGGQERATEGQSANAANAHGNQQNFQTNNQGMKNAPWQGQMGGMNAAMAPGRTPPNVGTKSTKPIRNNGAEIRITPGDTARRLPP